LALLEFFLGTANTSFSGHVLLGIFDPADEFVPGQRRDVVPGMERRRVGHEGLTQIARELVHHPAGESRTTHYTPSTQHDEARHSPTARLD